MRRVMFSFVVLLALLVPNVAMASDLDGSVPPEIAAVMQRLDEAGERYEEAFQSFSPEEQAMVFDYLRITGVETTTVSNYSTSSGMAIMAAGCWDRTRTSTYVNQFGATMITYSQRMRWCGDGQFIHTRAEATESWTTPSMYWAYVDTPTWWTSGGINWNGFESYRQAHFQACIVGFCTHSYPSVYQHGGGNGFYHSEVT